VKKKAKDYFAFMNQEYAKDIAELREKFVAVDRTDLESLRQWFNEHSYLTSNNICQIAGISLKTLRRWRRAIGQAGPKRLPPRRRKQPPRPLPTPPPDWRAGTWLEDQYQRYSVRDIARVIGRSYTFTRRLLRRRGVVLRPLREAIRSKNPCCTRAWLDQHYTVAGLSLTRCARLAGVSSSTMTSWLLQFDFMVRSPSEQLTLSSRIKSGVLDASPDGDGGVPNS
jgi:transposase-like protein